MQMVGSQYWGGGFLNLTRCYFVSSCRSVGVVHHLLGELYLYRDKCIYKSNKVCHLFSFTALQTSLYGKKKKMHMQWMNNECQHLFYTQLLLQDGHGQWETLAPIYQTQINTKHPWKTLHHGMHKKLKNENKYNTTTILYIGHIYMLSFYYCKLVYFKNKIPCTTCRSLAYQFCHTYTTYM